jgi:hypothetical protein
MVGTSVLLPPDACNPTSFSTMGSGGLVAPTSLTFVHERCHHPGIFVFGHGVESVRGQRTAPHGPRLLSPPRALEVGTGTQRALTSHVFAWCVVMVVKCVLEWCEYGCLVFPCMRGLMGRACSCPRTHAPSLPCPPRALQVLLSPPSEGWPCFDRV